MRSIRMALVVLSMVALQGCVAVALTAGGLAAGAGVDHTLSGIAYKTFSAPLEDVRLATLKTLSRMDIEVTGDTKSGGDREILAKAVGRTIEIELEAVTGSTTRMRVVVNKGDIFFKDSSTATEIIIQTAGTLDRQNARAK